MVFTLANASHSHQLTDAGYKAPAKTAGAFRYFFYGAPATNNPIENYYSTSPKTQRKKQFGIDSGIKNQLKLSAMKRAGLLGGCEKTLLEMLLMFIPFMDSG